ncbi:hypothetical protein [Azospirillum largimobile]
MVDGNSLVPGQHYEVDWPNRYSPPAPGMVLLDQRHTADGGRAMFVWGLGSGWREIVCWSEPEGAPVTDSLCACDCGLGTAVVWTTT